MKSLLSVTSLLATALIICCFSCKKTDAIIEVKNAENTNPDQTKLILDSVIAHPGILPLQLTSYSLLEMDKISIDSIKKEMLDASAIVADFDGLHPASLKLRSIREVEMPLVMNNKFANYRAQLKLYLDFVMKPNIGIAVLKWTFKDQIVSSYCIYGPKGPIYDNIANNIVYIKDNTPAPKKAEKSIM